MRQRVSIARALVVKPEVLLMDEPFASLDAQLRMILQDEMVQLWERDRRTVVFITHNIDEAIFLGDRVIVMSARPGRICAGTECRSNDPGAGLARSAGVRRAATGHLVGASRRGRQQLGRPDVPAGGRNRWHLS